MSDAQSEAWANDPSFSVVSSDDPSSRALKAGLKRWVFPGYPTLCAFALAVLMFRFDGGFVVLGYVLIFWLFAQFAFRAKSFGLETAAAIGAVRDVFARVGAVRAHAKAQKSAQAAAPQTGAGVRAFASIPETPPPLTQTQYEPPKPKRATDWGKLAGLAIVLGCIFGVLVLADTIKGMFDGPSGREVAAEAAAGVAESERRTSQAETDMGRAVIPIVEAHNEGRARAQAEVRTAREAIASAPDLEARYAAYRDSAVRLRDEGGSASASAVHALRSELDP